MALKIFMDKNEQLRRIIENAQSDPDSFEMVRRHAIGILTHLGVNQEDSEKFVLEEIKNAKISNLSEYEDLLHDKLNSFGIYEKLDGAMEKRAKEWFKKIEQYLIKGTLLDLGGGSGEVSKLAQEVGCEVSIADVINWNKFNIPFIKVEGEKVEAEDNSFDQVILLTVVHHTDDIKALIKESFRLAKKRVIFMESVTENLPWYQYGAWIDWFYNRIIHYSKDLANKINVPCNFLPATGWEQLIWKLTGLKPTVSKNVGIYQHLNPENHHLLVYDKE